MTVLESVVVDGDLKRLTSEERLEYYRQRCDAAGLDPRSQPFQYLSLQGKLTLYATKAATDSLAANRNLSVEVMSRQMTEGDIYEVVCRVRDPGGRVTEDMGAVFIGDARGEALANLRLKAITKGKRRTILAHCGLGMLDEAEVDSVAGAHRVRVNEHGEVLGELQPAAPAAPVIPPAEDLAYWRRRAMALYSKLGGDPSNRDACRSDFAAILGIDVHTRKELEAADWQKIACHCKDELDLGEEMARVASQKAAQDERLERLNSGESLTPEEMEAMNAETNQAVSLRLQGAEEGTYAQQRGL